MSKIWSTLLPSPSSGTETSPSSNLASSQSSKKGWHSASAAVMRFLGLKHSILEIRCNNESLSSEGRACCFKCWISRFLRVGGDINCVRTYSAASLKKIKEKSIRLRFLRDAHKPSKFVTKEHTAKGDAQQTHTLSQTAAKSSSEGAPTICAHFSPEQGKAHKQTPQPT